MLIPFTGYAPDLDPATPGIITNLVDYYPTAKGYGAAPSNFNSGFSALPTACLGGALIQKLDGSSRLFVGTATALYEASAIPTYTDRSRVGGYSAGADHRWSFAQFGDTSLAAIKSNLLQSSSTGAFADIAGAPKARFVETVPGFVILADTNEATYGDQSDRWWCSAYNDATGWTPAVSTQCTTGRLIGSPGPIKGWKRLGDDIVAYKDRAIIVGRYVGSPAVFEFNQLPGDVGCSSNDAIVSIGSAHFFIGLEDFYLFDGSRPIGIGGPVKKTFFTDLNKQYRYKIVSLHDRINSLVMFFYPSTASTTGVNDSCICYNYKTDKWGKINRGAEAGLENLTGQITYANINSYFATYADINITYDSPFWSQNYPVPTIFDTAHTMQTLTGIPGTCSITTGDMGDDNTFTLLDRVRPRFSTAPTSATLTNYYRNTSGSSLTQDQTVTMTSGKCDLFRSSRWHRLKLSTSGVSELSSIDVSLQGEGTE